MNWNTKVEQHAFNDYITESVWNDDCDSCAQEAHNVDQITHECYVCSEFAPHQTTYNYLDFVFLLAIPATFLFLYRLFYPRRKR